MMARPNLLHDHPSEEVRSAMLRLLDALCQWERNTGRNNVVIVKDKIGLQYRSLSGGPVPDDIPDVVLLANFEAMP